MSNTPTITCPSCGTSFALDETLAGPLIAKVKADAQAQVDQAKNEYQQRATALQASEAEQAAKEKLLAEREAALQAQVDQRVAAERSRIAEQERANAKAEMTLELGAERKRRTELEEKLQGAQAAELALRQEKDAIEARAKALDLEVARRVDADRKAIRERAEQEAHEKHRLEMLEKDKTITDMRQKLAEAERKGAQGSQQLQGEVLEQDFESALRSAFPQDVIEAVKAGQRGGDVLQHVLGQLGRSIGTIFWELKRTQAWGGDWSAKARQDAASVRAEVAVIVSDALPKGIEHFGPYEGVWVTRPAYATMLGAALRHGLMQTVEARGAAEGRETKMERLYAYMIGPEFRATLEGIAQPFVSLQSELASEKRATLARWKRQEKHLERVLGSVAALQGDLQAIAGAEMPELPGFVQEVEEEVSE